MNLVQIFLLFLFFFISVESSSEKARSKRTLNYFFDGLFKVFSDKRSYTPKSRATSDHKLSPLATFAKLSSIITQPKKFDALDDNDNDGDDDEITKISHVSPIVENTQNKTIINNHSSTPNETLNDSNVEASTISSVNFSTKNSLKFERNQKFIPPIIFLYQPHVQVHTNAEKI